MYCLFGLMDYSGALTAKQKVGALHALATAAEARGTDATGIAYRAGGRLHVYKRPLPGHRMHFRLPQDTRVIMGHTRMTTQGSAKKNFNNHPFQARAGGRAFALAHNGMIQNDLILHRKEQLPRTNIQTDSYVAIQLLEQSGAISSHTLGAMAEKQEGTFAFTVLDSYNNLYFIRGNNSLCIYHFPAQGLYLYAPTREILDKTIGSISFRLAGKKVVDLTCDEKDMPVPPLKRAVEQEVEATPLRVLHPICPESGDAFEPLSAFLIHMLTQLVTQYLKLLGRDVDMSY